MRRWGCVLLMVTAVAIGAALLKVAARPLHGEVPTLIPATALVPAPARTHWVGTATCAAGVCHGQGGATSSPGSEYDTWSTRDPHARAFTVLREERSARMVHQLGIATPATAAPRCLTCHVGSGFESLDPNAALGRSAGVGCESCHGPAGQWVDAHYRADWETRTLFDKTSLGMQDTKSIVGRALVCIPCHVGSVDAAVDHDLLAAGHPPLRFEFAAYHANLPRHWPACNDLQPSGKPPTIDPRGWPDFAARAWIVGQLESARAVLDVLEARAGNSGTWPEFASYDCFACHHDLQPASWRQRFTDRPHGATRIAWESWYTSLVPHALTAADSLRDRPAPRPLGDLRRTMESRRGLVPALPGEPWRVDRGRDARSLAKTLHAHAIAIAAQPAGKLALQPLARSLLAEQKAAALDWQHATQLYLALAAVRNGWHDSGAPHPALAADVTTALENLGQSLWFGEGERSPRSFDPARLTPR